MTTAQSAADFEERIDAAARATTAAATEVQTIVTSELTAMSAAWAKATAEVDDLEAQRAALLSVANVYDDELSKLWSSYPKGRPREAVPAAPLLSEVVVRLPGRGWAVGESVMDQLSRDLRDAQRARGDAYQHPFVPGVFPQRVRTATASVQGIVLALQARADQLVGERETRLETRDSEADSTREPADRRLAEARSRLSDAMRRLPPGMSPWSSPSWLSWRPVFGHSHVFLGMLRRQPGQAPGKNHTFGSDAVIPAFVPIREALRVSHHRQDRDTALALARSVLLRALASTPPGKLRLAVFDPTGLGQSVSSLLELGEYDRDLIGGKVWSSTEDLQSLLAEHTAHIELVIQKYLRAEYATLDEFNVAAGEIAEPYRLLAIFDAPSGLDERAFSELRRVIENGPRCGVSTLLVTDEDLQSPYGVSLDALPQSLKTLQLDMPFGHSAGGNTIAFDLIPDTDTAAPAQVVRSIIHEVGKASQESTSAAVSFDKSFGLFSQAALDGRKRGLPRFSTPVDVANPDDAVGVRG